MKYMLSLTMFIMLFGTISVKADCVVTDPTGSQLNVRDAINGSVITKIPNGKKVIDLDTEYDHKDRPWTYVKFKKGRKSYRGWVFRSYLHCY